MAVASVSIVLEETVSPLLCQCFRSELHCPYFSHTAAAVATDDYTAIVSLPLMFDANDTFQTVRIIITDDSIVEFTEHFFAFLTTVDPFVDLMPDEARVNILDDDRKINELSVVLYALARIFWHALIFRVF